MNMEQFSGRVWLLGDDIDTDIIIPTEYLALKTVEDMKPFAFSPLRPELAGQITEGDIIGCVAAVSNEDGFASRLEKTALETEVKLIQTAAAFLGRQLEG